MSSNNNTQPFFDSLLVAKICPSNQPKKERERERGGGGYKNPKKVSGISCAQAKKGRRK
jgi:hypothetical protein